MKILKFYLYSCLWTALYDFIALLIAKIMESEDFLYAFPITLITICFIYSPIWTVLAVLYQKLRINDKVIEYPLIVSIVPCVLYDIINQTYEDKYLMEYILIAENIIIIIWSLYLKKKNKNT